MNNRPCKPVYIDIEDDLTYCERHDRLVCPTCQRHTVENDAEAGPGEPLNCPVHGTVARVGHP